MTEKLMNAQASFVELDPQDITKNPWRYTWETDRDNKGPQYDFIRMIKRCRFYYRRDPLTSTTINKLIDIGINKIVFHKNGLSDNEFKLFVGLESKLLGFAEDMALEYLLSGLVVPEIDYGSMKKNDLQAFGIKKYTSLKVPTNMWVRDPTSIEIKESVLPDTPSYFVTVPDEMLYFIRNKGTYLDGSYDLPLYDTFINYSPEFVTEIQAGKNKVLLSNDLIIRRRVGTESPYPTPYLSSAVDILEHKRNLRRTDYSIANKVLSAILQVKIGSDMFPQTDSEEDRKFVEALRGQLRWRNRYDNDIENIFQLFTSHVVELKWVFPDVAVLLNDAKYTEINQEILFALGFPRILITGETERSSAGDSEFASLAPIKTMDNFRDKILAVLKDITYQISDRNNFSATPEIEFEPINFHKFAEYMAALSKLFDSGGLSRDSMAKVLGYNFDDEVEQRGAEQKKVQAFAVPAFGENPNSRNPNVPGQPQSQPQPQTGAPAPSESSGPNATKKASGPTGATKKVNNNG